MRKKKPSRNWTGGIGALIMTSLDIYTQKIKSTTRHESSSPVVWTRPLPIQVWALTAREVHFSFRIKFGKGVVGKYLLCAISSAANSCITGRLSETVSLALTAAHFVFRREHILTAGNATGSRECP